MGGSSAQVQKGQTSGGGGKLGSQFNRGYGNNRGDGDPIESLSRNVSSMMQRGAPQVNAPLTLQQPMMSSTSQTPSSMMQRSGPPGLEPLQGANGVITNSATSGQPQMGAANQYSNTVGQWDNAAKQPNQSSPQMGKGKGA